MKIRNHFSTKKVQGLTIILLMHLSFYCNILKAENQKNKSAYEVAAAFFAPGSGNSTTMSKVSAIRSEITEKYRSLQNTTSEVYVFGRNTGGFVIVSGNSANYNVVAYSTNTNFQELNVPEALTDLIHYYEQNSVNQDNVSTNAYNSVAVVSPLLQVHLDQFRHAEVGNCPTGCVATAFAQIMAYYKYPAHGIGSNCYTTSNYGELCADFQNSAYNWLNPTESDYTKLSYHLGVAMNMQYCHDASGSIPGNYEYRNVLKNNFGYHTIADVPGLNYIKNELDHARPVYSELRGTPGHAVVIDGYDSNDFFHVDFGWGGSYNGYFKLNDNSDINVGNIFKSSLISTLFVSPTPYVANKQDSLALVAFHNSMNGSTNWDLTKPVSEWKGVILMNERVVAIQLYYDNELLNGSVPAEIGNLTELKIFHIKGYFTGTLPTTVANLTKLEILNIETIPGSTLTGTIPANIGNLTKLQFLSVNNTFTGLLPASVGQLKDLYYLNLPGGKLSGSIPESITNLTNLSFLDLSANELSGNVPASVGQLIKLTDLNLSTNKLSGNIPESIGSLTSLTNLGLNNNEFTGKLPAGIGNLSLLKTLDVSSNKLSEIPVETGNLNLLENLNISNNQLLTLPVSLNNLQNLKVINASGNKINTLAENFGSWTDATDIDFSNNELTEFPIQFCYLGGLNTLNLEKNKISELPAEVQYFPNSMQYLNLQDNDMEGNIPADLLESDIFELYLKNNRFGFENLLPSSEYKHKVDLQKNVLLSKNIIKVMMGDTVTLDIRNLTDLKQADNKYFWCKYPRYAKESRLAYMTSVENNPVFQVVINEKTIRNKYYCKVFNPASPTYTFTDGINTYSDNLCLTHLNTDTISFQLVSEDEMYAEKYSDSYFVTSDKLIKKEVEDETVTLVPPMNIRGNFKWQASADKNVWYDLSTSMSQADLKANILSLNVDKLVLSPQTPAYYRSVLTEAACDPIYSDTVKVNPYGLVLYDSVANVNSESKTVALDSIEVTIPEKFYDQDFRITVVKLDNPPAAPAGYELGSVYDVNVSFADKFDAPLIVKLKNLNKYILNDTTIYKYKPVYFDDVKQKWIEFDNGSIALNDSCMVFYTNHLTKLSWWNSSEYAAGYTDVYEKNNIRVVWAQGDETKFKYVQSPQSWHTGDAPLICQDIVQYITEIQNKFRSLQIYQSDKTLTVYLKKMEDDGVVGWMAMLNNYLSINYDIDDPDLLKSLLAHEYMHVVQSHYIYASPGNIFWMEANAHLTDRMVWNESILPISQSDDYINESDMVGFLSKSWDYWDRTTLTQNLTGDINYCYAAGTFIHYMRSYRDGDKLKPEILLKETPGSGSWREYLDAYIQKYLKSNIGAEYENFVKYIMQGSNENFALTLTNGKSNPYTQLNKGGDTKEVIYNFKNSSVIAPVTEKIDTKLPYLSAKIILLSNKSENYGVVVNYKRLNAANDKIRAYYGYFVADQNKIELVDISDSLKYNFYLESGINKYARKVANKGFILLINKDMPVSMLSEKEIESSIEITATPVVNLTDLSYITVAPEQMDKRVHWNTDGTKDYIYIAGEIDNLGSYDDAVYTNSKQLKGDSIILVHSSFMKQTTSENGFGLPNSTYTREFTQSVEYNFIEGNYDIEQVAKTTHTLSAYHDEVTDKDMPARLSSVSNKTTRFKLTGVNGFVKVPLKKLMFFKSKGSIDSQEIIESMSSLVVDTQYNSDGSTETKTSRYESTDFESEEVYIYIWLGVE